MTVSDKNCNSHPGYTALNQIVLDFLSRPQDFFHDQMCGILLTLFWRYLVLPSLQCLLIHLRNGRVFNDWRLALIMY